MRFVLIVALLSAWRVEVDGTRSFMVGEHACGIMHDSTASTFTEYGASSEVSERTFKTPDKAAHFVEHQCRFNVCTYGRPGAKCSISTLK